MKLGWNSASYFIFSDEDKSKNLIKCEECGLTCAGRSHYNVHIRSHTGERPYICHICGFGFTQKEIVPNHLTWKYDNILAFCYYEYCLSESKNSIVLIEHWIREIFDVITKFIPTINRINALFVVTNAGEGMHWTDTCAYIPVSLIFLFGTNSSSKSHISETVLKIR